MVSPPLMPGGAVFGIRFDNPLGVESPFYELDTSKLQSMGFKFRGIDDMFDDVIESVEELRRGLTSNPTREQNVV